MVEGSTSTPRRQEAGVDGSPERSPGRRRIRRPARWIVPAGALWLVACGPGPDAPSASSPDPEQPSPYVTLTHPDWTRSAALYQLNTRQFTPEGTFRAAMEHLPRIRELGADMVMINAVTAGLGVVQAVAEDGLPAHFLGQLARLAIAAALASRRNHRAVAYV